MYRDSSIHIQNRERKTDQIYHGCCEWWTFRDSFLKACWHLKVPMICVNRLQARRHWREGWTAWESAHWFKIELLKELY